MQSADAAAGLADAAERGTIYTGEIDITPPDNFDWKTVSETKLTVKSTTEMCVSLQSKPYTDTSVFQDVDCHAAEVSYYYYYYYYRLCFDAFFPGSWKLALSPPVGSI